MAALRQNMATDIDLVVLELKLAALVSRLERRHAPDQPRVPAGSSEGGQWTDGASFSSVAPEPAMRIAANKDDGRFMDYLQS